MFSDVIADSKHYIGSLFAYTWKRLKSNSLIIASGLTMRSRIEITEAVLVLLLWEWVNISSIAMFSRSPWEHSQAPDKDVMYDKPVCDSLPDAGAQ